MGRGRKRPQRGGRQSQSNKRTKWTKRDFKGGNVEQENKARVEAEMAKQLQQQQQQREQEESSYSEDSEVEPTPMEQLREMLGHKRKIPTAYSSESESEESDDSKTELEKTDSEDEGETEKDDETESESEEDEVETEEDLKGKDWLSEHFEKILEEPIVKDILGEKDRSSSDEVLEPLGEPCKFIKTSPLAKLVFNSEKSADTTSLQTDNKMYSIISTYRDFVFSGYHGNYAEFNQKKINTVCLHLTQHVLRSRAKILHHNVKLKQQKLTSIEVEYRDQGLTRPKVLVMLPFRSSVMRYVNAICGIVGDSAVVMNKKRFYTSYSSKVDEEVEKKRLKRKPVDYQNVFQGNTGEDFFLSLAIKKKFVRLFAPLYSSDIIIASPMALKKRLTDGNDFLSSIEVLIMDQYDVMVMQNYLHIIDSIQEMNKLPKAEHGADIFRVRLWNVESEWAKCYRQTIAFASYASVEFDVISNRLCFNYAGIIKCSLINPENGGPEGEICRVNVKLPHTFQRFYASTPQNDPKERLKFFEDVVFPQFKSILMNGTVIFVSYYWDYVYVRNFLRKNDVGFAQICEYHEPGKVAEARDKFFHRHRKFLLYTERTHFYNRYKIKGVKHLLFYQLPSNPIFYSEICNLAGLPGKHRSTDIVSPTCSAIVSRFDHHRLSAIVGSDKATQILHDSSTVHRIITD
ncbi:hypothetical protein CHUAL_006245 [Chamberlinius hualienensis]